jgi:hypothetical protein
LLKSVVFSSKRVRVQKDGPSTRALNDLPSMQISLSFSDDATDLEVMSSKKRPAGTPASLSLVSTSQELVESNARTTLRRVTFDKNKLKSRRRHLSTDEDTEE